MRRARTSVTAPPSLATKRMPHTADSSSKMNAVARSPVRNETPLPTKPSRSGTMTLSMSPRPSFGSSTEVLRSPWAYSAGSANCAPYSFAR